jgi:hypothetical protein
VAVLHHGAGKMVLRALTFLKFLDPSRWDVGTHFQSQVLDLQSHTTDKLQICLYAMHMQGPPLYPPKSKCTQNLRLQPSPEYRCLQRSLVRDLKLSYCLNPMTSVFIKRRYKSVNGGAHLSCQHLEG